jgi:type III secretion protein T
MDPADQSGWAGQLLLLGLSTARFAAAFALLPLFATETVPALVRNSILLAFGLLALTLQPAIAIQGLSPAEWIGLYAKEVFVGLAIGLFFGSILWAFEAAGQIVDTKIGSSMAQVVDPLGGHQTSLNGALLGRLATVLFAMSGGLALLVGTILESFAIWPMGSAWPRFGPEGVRLFEAELGRLMAMAVLFAAPILLILFLIDLGLGLVNRFAQQLNVFALSLSIKAAAGTALLILLLPALIQALLDDLAVRPAAVRALLEALGQ